MLVLTRKPRQEIQIGNGVTITVLRVKGQSVRIGIEAPNDIRIVRGELNLTSDQDAPSSQASPADATDQPQRTGRQTQALDLDDLPHQGHTAAVSSGPTLTVEDTSATCASSSLTACGQRIPQRGRNSTLRMLAARHREAALDRTGRIASPPLSVK